MKPQSTALSWVLAALARFSSIAKLTGMSDAGGCPRWMCQTGLASRAAGVLPGEGAQLLVVLVDRLGDHVEIEPLRGLRLAGT